MGSDFFFELGEEGGEKLGSFFGEGFSGLGLHGVLEGEEFGEEMIDAEVGVVVWAGLAEGVGGVVKLGAHVAAEHETAAEADGAEGIDAVGILQDLGLDGAWGDVGGEAVGLDGVVDGVEVLIGVVVFAEEADGVIGSETGGLGAEGGVFGNVEAVVKVGGGEEDIEREVFGCGEVAGVEDDTLDVLEIVGGIAFFPGGEEGAEEGDPVGGVGHGKMVWF